MTKRAARAGSNKSTTKQRRALFAAAYLSNGHNATQAAISAGYSAKTAYAAGHRLLKHPEVAPRLAAVAEKAAAAAELTVERTLREVARVAYFDPRTLYRDDGSLKRPDEWTDDTAAAVAGIEVSEEFEGKGDDRELSGYLKKFKIWDKNAALEKAMKHLGLFEKDNAQQAESLVLRVEAAKPVTR